MTKKTCEQKEIKKRILKTMRKGFAMGKILYKQRYELYTREESSEK